MTTVQSMAARTRREALSKGLPCNTDGGTYRTRSDAEQAQFESDKAWQWQFSIIKCYGSMEAYFRIQRRQHGVHDHPIKPKELA